MNVKNKEELVELLLYTKAVKFTINNKKYPYGF